MRLTQRKPIARHVRTLSGCKSIQGQLNVQGRENVHATNLPTGVCNLRDVGMFVRHEYRMSTCAEASFFINKRTWEMSSPLQPVLNYEGIYF